MSGLFEKTIFAHRRPPNLLGIPRPKYAIIMHACHETAEETSELGGYGQAIAALDLGIRRLGYESFRAVPYLAGYEPLPGRPSAFLNIETGSGAVKICALESEDNSGSPLIMLKNMGDPAYFAHRDGRTIINELSGGAPGNYASRTMDEKNLVFNLALFEFAKLARETLENEETMFLFHGHDHLTGLATALATINYIRTIFTVHNPAYSTAAPPELVNRLGFNFPADHGPVDLLALALGAARRITTVSRVYANEISHPGFNFGPVQQSYGQLLAARVRHGGYGRFLTGILNGLLPEFLHTRFPVTRPEDDETVRVVMPSRLVEQKGYGFLTGGLGEAVNQFRAAGLKVKFTVIGDGEEKIRDDLTGLSREVPELELHPYSQEEMFRHLAWADLALFPSVYEPCCLGAMTAQAAGVLTLGTSVGGLREIIGSDSHCDYDIRTGIPGLEKLTAVLHKCGLVMGEYGLAFPATFPGPLSAEKFWCGLTGAITLIHERVPELRELRARARERAQSFYTPDRVAADYLRCVYGPYLSDEIHKSVLADREKRGPGESPALPAFPEII